eukprot:g5995.t1
MKTHMLSVTVASRDFRKPRPALDRFMRPGTTPGHPGPKASQPTDAKHPKQKEEVLQNKLYILYRLDRISELALPWLIIAGSSSPISSWRACSKISKQSRPRSGAASHPPGRSSSSSNRYISKLKNAPTAAAVCGTQLSVLVHYAQDSGRLRLVQEERLWQLRRGERRLAALAQQLPRRRLCVQAAPLHCPTCSELALHALPQLLQPQPLVPAELLVVHAARAHCRHSLPTLARLRLVEIHLESAHSYLRDSDHTGYEQLQHLRSGLPKTDEVFTSAEKLSKLAQPTKLSKELSKSNEGALALGHHLQWLHEARKFVPGRNETELAAEFNEEPTPLSNSYSVVRCRPAPAGAHLASRAVTIDELPTAHRPNSAPSNWLPSAQRRATFSSTVCPSAKWLSTRALAKSEAIAPALSRCSASGQVAFANARHRQRSALYQSRSVASAPGRLRTENILSRRPLCLRPHPLPEPIRHWRERPASPPEATAISSSDLKADRESRIRYRKNKRKEKMQRGYRNKVGGRRNYNKHEQNSKCFAMPAFASLFLLCG